MRNDPFGTISSEDELLDEALRALRRRLPAGWAIEEAADGDPDGGSFLIDSGSDAARGSVLVEAKLSFAPADVDRLLGGISRRRRQAAGQPTVLLVSPYLSPRTRQLLTEEDVSYLDLTGNVRLTLRHPGLFIEAVGTQRRRHPPGKRTTAGLAGPNAGRIIRFLVEVPPPYSVTDIEKATGVSRGWISRTLDALADQALVRREPRGPVESVDWPALLRERGRTVDLSVHTTRRYVARDGARAVLDAVPNSELADKIYVTGSYAAVRVAPIAAPALLALYLDPDGRPAYFGEAAAALRLLEVDADGGADVMLLRPNGRHPIRASRRESGLRLVNYPQLVIDCLGGTGRMPAEGEAVLEWMQRNTPEWQYGSLADYLERRPADDR